ncbi:MAG: gliding motility-associated C-terminal domain-containing protein [Bacteroidales bacterium]|jgi:gliding motility-associated-like protein|nr:gliding motility-associated C-terminal domain-containing protein [Bacteroidales bacterium]
MHEKILFCFCLFFLPVMSLFATHQRAGEITYRHIRDLTYEITVITYTYTPSPAKRPEIDVWWGDGTYSTIPRESETNMANNITLNRYIAQHTFPATGNYHITFEDPNRNAGIVNIENSVNIPFFLETILYIHPFLGYNDSPVLLNPPIDNGCYGKPFYHNPGAYDPDGDSLSYSLISCRGYEGEVIPGYKLPAASSHIDIDPVTGDFTWDSPTLNGEYNIAILIREWRAGELIGSIVRDMQISIAPCNNEPPSIEVKDTCVLAGTNLSIPVIAMDPNSTNVTLSATGDLFQLSSLPAVFAETSGAPPLRTTLHWQTICNHVRKNPYTVLFKVTDNGPTVALSNYKQLHIQVIAPAPKNLIATAEGNHVNLSWTADSCPNATGYDLYRRIGSNPFSPDECETGLSPDKGYQRIATLQGYDHTTFTDDGSLLPLHHGHSYCYRVVAFFADGAESIVSTEACVALLGDAPMITHADVEKTDSSKGKIWVRWVPPTILDTNRFPGPRYEYHLFREKNYSGIYEPVAVLQNLKDTSFIDENKDTKNNTYRYKVELHGESAGTLYPIETSDPASTVFLSITPEDRALHLSWTEQVPWQNVKYVIYRLNTGNNAFDSIAETTTQTYIDRHLFNGRTYRYFVKAVGQYTDPDSLFPLYNRSQECQEIPEDKIPPELPEIQFTTDCKTLTLSWQFATDTSCQDLFLYEIYYKPTLNAEFQLWETFTSETYPCHTFLHKRESDANTIIVGCFAIALLDSNGNRSPLSEPVCFDYDQCINYRLPNTFTPNGDGYNDLFRPFPYENVSKIKMHIYDRWGRLVFKTEDPDINWDGHDQHTGLLAAEGMYRYSCEIEVPSLSGTVSIPLHGSILLIRGKKNGM